MADIGDRSVSIGRIFSRTFGVMGDNPLVVFGISLVLSGIPVGIFNGFFRQALGQAVENGLSAATAMQSGLGFLVAMLLQWLVMGCITRATVAYSQGERASVGDCFSVTLPRLLPIFVVSILAALGIGLGFLLLIVPGVILACMWAVVVPVLLAEKTSIFGAFSRSSALTKGARWKILGLFLLVGLIFWGINLAAGLISGIVLGAAFTNPLVATQPIALILSVVVTTLTTTLMAANTTALFVELRGWKDGPQDAQLSDIFS